MEALASTLILIERVPGLLTAFLGEIDMWDQLSALTQQISSKAEEALNKAGIDAKAIVSL